MEILCLPKSEFDKLGIPKGFSYHSEEWIFNNILENNLVWVERESAERDPNFKQIIPYCVVQSSVRLSNTFAYQRTKKGAEGRLHGKWSIGVGGHIERGDSNDLEGRFYAALKRELSEELGIYSDDYKLIGLIYDDSNEVGQVHLGVVVSVRSNEEDVKPEDQMANAKFYHNNEIFKLDKQGVFENWSKLILEKM